MTEHTEFTGRNIVILCDGTGNEISENISNVLKLYRCLRKTAKTQPRQFVYYDPGVGTLAQPSTWHRIRANISLVLGLATGYGLDDNVLSAYQFLVNSIALALEDAGGRSLLITSAGPTDGKTLTAANLGIAAAQDGREVLLVDADTRIRGLTRLFDISAERGLDALAAGTPLVDLVTLLETGDQHAALIPAVPLGEDTAAFFRTPQFREAARGLDDAADLVLYDTPPLLLASDTSAIAGHVAGIVVVVARGTPIRQLETLRERLDRVGTPVIGYIFTKDRLHGSYGYGRYRYGYEGYGSVEREASSA